MKATTSKAKARTKRSAAKAPAKRARAKTPVTRAKPAPRKDFGAPIDGFFDKQPKELRAILVALRKVVERTAPEATSAIKWGMPFYSIGSARMCALAGHKSHVNLIMAGPPEVFVDPDRRLEGGGKTGRHLKLRSLDELPKAAVQRWLRAAAEVARKKAR